MEYKLNKIDPNLRQKVNNATKEGIVHGTKNIAINKGKSEDNKENSRNKPKLQEQEKNKKLLIDAIKAENIEIEAVKEEHEASKGRYLDTKK
jgi:hypothetical protein